VLNSECVLLGWSGQAMADAPAVTRGEEVDSRRAAWMAAAQAGDSGAYARLLRDCLPLIRAAARGRGVPPDSVEDVVQDVLLTLHRVRHTYDPARSFNAWLHAIADRRAIDHQRRQGRRRAREIHAPEVYDAHPDPQATAEHRVDMAGRAAMVAAALATLPPGQREAVERLALQDQSLAEASADTGRSKGALKVNLHRALKALRARLGTEA
jgi:RNA polymerase sigma factor (sigma-70 family)